MKMSKRAWALLLALVLTAGNILTASAAANPHSDPVVYDYDEKYKLIITPVDQYPEFFHGCAFSLCYCILQRRYRAEEERRRRHYVSPDGVRCGDGRLPFLERMVRGAFLNT